jgi:ribonuclease BN (tRNA processing enzyme)
MKYIIKALNSNNRDLKTALLFTINDVIDKMYLFSCPDGFQRVANVQKLKFQKVNLIFVPSLTPDHFAGFPGFFLSAREGLASDVQVQEKMKIMLVGPKGTVSTMQKSIPFTGQYSTNLDVIEIPSDLNAPYFEESKDTDQIFCFVPETNRMAF